MRLFYAFSASFLLTAPIASGAFAQPSPQPTQQAAPVSLVDDSGLERAQQARERFSEGMEHYRARRFREAIRAFEALAASLVPSADLWFNIARSHEQLSQWADAAEYYRRYLRDRVDPPDRVQIEAQVVALDERAEADRQSRRQAPTTGTLRIDATPTGAQISVDARPIGHAPLTEPLALIAGRHALQSSADLRIPARAEISLEAGVATVAYLDSPPLTMYRAVRGRRVWTWVLAGLTGAGIATTLGFGIHAQRVLDDGNRDGARTWATRSDAFLVGSLVTAVGAIILFFVEGRSIGTERVTPGAATAEQSRINSGFAF